MEAKNQLKAMKSYKGILTFINIVAGNRKKGEFLIYDLRRAEELLRLFLGILSLLFPADLRRKIRRPDCR